MSITTARPPRTTGPELPQQSRHVTQHERRPDGAATSLPGRHRRHDDPAMPRRHSAAIERTRAFRPVDRAADGLARPSRLPFPRTAGLLIRQPDTGALAVSCNARGSESPGADRFPCFAVIEGHAHHGNHLWLTYGEACAHGFELVGDVHHVAENA